MKPRKLLIVLVFGSSSALSACGGSTAPTVRMVSSQSVPAASGTVKASRAANGNTAIEIEVRHLAQPHALQPSATTYVVWARPSAGARPQNLGALRVDQNLRGTLSTVTPLESFDVFITAEPSATVMAPTSERVLSASIRP